MTFDDICRVARAFRYRPKTGFLVGFLLLMSSLTWAYLYGCTEEAGRLLIREHSQDPSIPDLQGPEPIRITYFRFEGPTLIDHALDGYGFTEEDGFLERPDWLQNAVWEDAKSLLVQAGGRAETDKLPYDFLDLGVEDPAGPATTVAELRYYDTHRSRVREAFSGRIGTLRASWIQETFDPHSLFARVARDTNWAVRLRCPVPLDGKSAIPWDCYSFFATLDTEAALHWTSDPISRGVLSLRRDLEHVVFLKVEPLHGEYHGTVLIRQLRLLAMELENVGDQPVAIDRLVVRQLRADSPLAARSDEEQSAELERLKRGDTAPPLDSLAPGEHLFIPLWLELGFASDWTLGDIDDCITKDDLPKDIPAARGAQSIRFEILRSLDRDYRPTVSETSLPSSVFERNNRFEHQIPSRYFLGSSIIVEEISIRDNRGPRTLRVRLYDPKRLVSRGGFEKGSCPVLYSGESGSWRRVRNVLVDAVSADREAEDRVRVVVGEGRFALVEEEPEVSFIDRVVLEIEVAGSVRTVRPRGIPELAERDGVRLKLGRGDDVVLDFDVMGVAPETEAEIAVSGFYVPEVLLNR